MVRHHKIAGISSAKLFDGNAALMRLIMPTNLYGPGDNYHLETNHVLPALIHDFMGSRIEHQALLGRQVLTERFLHADDLGEACVSLENWQPESHEPSFLNVGTGVDLAIRELAVQMAQVTGSTVQLTGTPSTRWCPKKTDVAMAKLGWRARIALDGLAMTVELFRAVN